MRRAKPPRTECRTKGATQGSHGRRGLLFCRHQEFDAPDALAGARRPRASEQDNEQFLKRKIDIFSLTFSPELGIGGAS